MEFQYLKDRNKHGDWMCWLDISPFWPRNSVEGANRILRIKNVLGAIIDYFIWVLANKKGKGESYTPLVQQFRYSEYYNKQKK